MTSPASRVVFAAQALLLVLGAPAVSAQPQTRVQQQAASLFKQAEARYADGDFKEAIKLFSQAQILLPHATTLFSIARCHENLGQPAEALAHYTMALRASPAAPLEANIRRRLQSLRTRPVKIFVSSRPSGARLTVDGRAAPEAQPTPTVVALRPGEHLLVLRLDGHQLAVRRVEVATGKEQAVELVLRKLPTPTRCPESRPLACPSLALMDDRTRFQFSANAVLGFGTRRPFSIGAGLSALGVYRRFLFGGRFWGQATVIQEIPSEIITDTTSDPTTRTTYNRSSLEWFLGQAVAGYMVPFGTAFVYGDVGLGLSFERTTFQGNRVYTSGPARESEISKHSNSAAAFVWSVGGGVEAMGARWFSVGFNIQLGMLHGERPDLYKPTAMLDDSTSLFATLSMAASFHL